MRKLFKWLGILLIGLIAVIVAAIVALVWVVNPNEYKDLVAAKVSQFTHRQVTIAGDLSWSFFPWLGLSVNDLQVSNLPNFAKQPFATVKHLEIRAQLVPLFEGQFKIKTITLDGLILNLQQNGNDKNNWTIVSETPPSKIANESETITNSQHPTIKPELPKALKQENSTLSPQKMVFAVSKLQVSDGQINFQNDKTQQKIQLSDLNLNSQDINLDGTSFPIDFSGQALQNNRAVQIKLQGQLELNLKDTIYQINSLVLDVRTTAKGEPPLHLILHSNATLNQQNQTLALNPLTISLDDAQFTGSIKGQHLMADPIFSGQLQSKPFQLQPLLHSLQMSPMPWPKTVTLGSNFMVSKDSASLEKLHASLDQSDLIGQVKITNFAHPAEQFNLHISQLNTAWFAGQKSESPVSVTSSSNKGVSNSNAASTPIATDNQSFNLPIATLRQLNLKGDLQIDRLDLSSIAMEHVKAQVNANNGIITIAPLTADLYQGHFNDSASLNVQGTVPSFQIHGQLQQIQVQPLLLALKKQLSLPISGQGDMQWSLNTSGNSQEALTQALNGNLKLAITNGVMNGIDVGYEIRRAVAFLHQQPMPQAPSQPVTKFGSLTASSVIHQGVVSNQDLRLDSPVVQVMGQGQIDLNRQTIAYQLVATALGGGLSPTVVELQRLLGGGVPIQINGNLAHPAIQPNWRAITEAAARALVQKQVDKVKEKAQEKIQQGVQDLGKKLEDAGKKLQLKLPF